MILPDYRAANVKGQQNTSSFERVYQLLYVYKSWRWK